MAATAAIQGQRDSWEDHAKVVFEELSEKQRRWVAGVMSEMLGWGGTKRTADLIGMDPKTIRQGRIDLQNNLDGFPSERIRREGGGRPRCSQWLRFVAGGNATVKLATMRRRI